MMAANNYRAWQIEHCEMCDVTAIDYNGKRLGFGRQLDQEHFNGPDYWLFMDECITMQSTGLHDKNGVEIFAFDLITHEGYIYEIIEWSMGLLAKSKTLSGEIHLPPYLIKESLVIGNIYENPELLEQSND